MLDILKLIFTEINRYGKKEKNNVAKKTIVLPGKAHSIPKCFVQMLYDLEKLVGEGNVGMGEFTNRGSKNTIKIKYYDSTRETMKITAFSREFNQDFYLKVPNSSTSEIEKQLLEYKI